MCVCKQACGKAAAVHFCAEGILGVDICGECDVAESGNSALNDRANAALLECFLSAYGSEDHDGNKNEITGGNR